SPRRPPATGCWRPPPRRTNAWSRTLPRAGRRVRWDGCAVAWNKVVINRTKGNCNHALPKPDRSPRPFPLSAKTKRLISTSSGFPSNPPSYCRNRLIIGESYWLSSEAIWVIGGSYLAIAEAIWLSSEAIWLLAKLFGYCRKLFGYWRS